MKNGTKEIAQIKRDKDTGDKFIKIDCQNVSTINGAYTLCNSSGNLFFFRGK